MGQTISLAAVYCCCSAGSSLCKSCFGSTLPGTTGRKRSVLLLGMVIAIALWFQYSVGPSIVSQSGWVRHIFLFCFLFVRLLSLTKHFVCPSRFGKRIEPSQGQESWFSRLGMSLVLSMKINLT